MSRNGKSDQLPVPSPKEVLVMQSLIQNGEQYGLQLVDRSAGQIRRGTVYVTLERMEHKGYITSRQEAQLPGAIGLPRRLYKLTGHGERVLLAWESYALAVTPTLAL